MIGDRTQLISDLRSRFGGGAAPSALIRYAVAALGEDATWAEIRAVLEEAFALAFVRIGNCDLPVSESVGVALNRSLLFDIVQSRGDWDPGGSATSERSWITGVESTSREDIEREVKTAPFPGIRPETWRSLTTEEQDQLSQLLVDAVRNSRRVNVLARLAERLQRIIDGD